MWCRSYSSILNKLQLFYKLLHHTSFTRDSIQDQQEIAASRLYFLCQQKNLPLCHRDTWIHSLLQQHPLTTCWSQSCFNRSVRVYSCSNKLRLTQCDETGTMRPRQMTARLSMSWVMVIFRAFFLTLHVICYSCVMSFKMVVTMRERQLVAPHYVNSQHFIEGQHAVMLLKLIIIFFLSWLHT